MLLARSCGCGGSSGSVPASTPVDGTLIFFDPEAGTTNVVVTSTSRICL